MNPLETIARAVLANMPDPSTVSDLAIRTGLTRDMVARGLAELAVADRVRRLVVEDCGYLVQRWVMQR